MLILKFWRPYTLFVETKNFKTWQPFSEIWHFCLSEVGKHVTDRFLVQKICTAKFWVILTSSSGFTVILRFFQKKINRYYLRFGFSLLSFHRKSISFLQFLRNQVAVFCSLLTTKLSIKIWNRFLNFCPKNFLELFKVKKIRKKI